MWVQYELPMVFICNAGFDDGFSLFHTVWSWNKMIFKGPFQIIVWFHDYSTQTVDFHASVDTDIQFFPLRFLCLQMSVRTMGNPICFSFQFCSQLERLVKRLPQLTIVKQSHFQTDFSCRKTVFCVFHSQIQWDK